MTISACYVETVCEGGCNACDRTNLKVWKINMGVYGTLQVRLCTRCWNELKEQIKRGSMS
jgi:hypothetical protein